MSRAPSIAKRLRAFFVSNPDEMLDYDDAAIKFGVHVDTVKNALVELRDEGFIETAYVIRRAPSGN